jgi:hypothetical protein
VITYYLTDENGDRITDENGDYITLLMVKASSTWRVVDSRTPTVWNSQTKPGTNWINATADKTATVWADNSVPATNWRTETDKNGTIWEDA